MALNYSTLRKPANAQVVDPETGRMREEWALYFDQLTTRLNGAVGELVADVAPADAQYIVGATSSGLSAERVVTNTSTVTWDLATAAQAKANVPAGVVDAGTLDGFDTSASGNRWGVIPVVGTDGVMEIGRYIDFHNSDADTGDAANRLETNGGTVGLFESPNLGGLKRIVSLTNSSLAQGDVIYYDGTNFVRLAPGTSGHFLKTNGAAANPAWAALPFTVATTQASTSGTAIDFTGLPTDVARIIMTLNAVSISGTNNLLVQIGDSGGIETTGYVSTAGAFGGTAATSTSGYIMRGIAASDSISGQVMLTRVSTTEWIASHMLRLNASNISIGGGTKALSAGPLDRVRLAMTGADTFDAGSVGLMYD